MTHYKSKYDVNKQKQFANHYLDNKYLKEIAKQAKYIKSCEKSRHLVYDEV